jgi:hypothetical protein
MTELSQSLGLIHYLFIFKPTISIIIGMVGLAKSAKLMPLIKQEFLAFLKAFFIFYQNTFLH